MRGFLSWEVMCYYNVPFAINFCRFALRGEILFAVQGMVYLHLCPTFSRISHCKGQDCISCWGKQPWQPQQLRGAASPDGFSSLSHHSCSDKKLSLGLTMLFCFQGMIYSHWCNNRVISYWPVKSLSNWFNICRKIVGMGKAKAAQWVTEPQLAELFPADCSAHCILRASGMGFRGDDSMVPVDNKMIISSFFIYFF